MARSVKEEAAYRQGLLVEQVKYWVELNKEQQSQAARWWGQIPPYENYLYAVRRDGDLVFMMRFRIEELGRGW